MITATFIALMTGAVFLMAFVYLIMTTILILATTNYGPGDDFIIETHFMLAMYMAFSGLIIGILGMAVFRWIGAPATADAPFMPAFPTILIGVGFFFFLFVFFCAMVDKNFATNRFEDQVLVSHLRMSFIWMISGGIWLLGHYMM